MNVDNVIKIASVQCRNGNYNVALKALHDALKQNPDSVPLHIKLAEVYDSQENSNKTIEYCSKVLKKSPDLSVAYALTGSAYMRRRDLNKAVSNILKALELDSRNDFAYEVLGRIVLVSTLPFIKDLSSYLDAKLSLFDGSDVKFRQLQEGIQYYQKGCTEKWQYICVYYRMGMLYYYANSPERLKDQIRVAADSDYEPAQEWLAELSKREV